MPLKKSLIKIIKILGIGFVILYPFIVFFALKKQIALRVLSLLLVFMAGVSFAKNKNVWLFCGILLLGICLAIFNQDIFLKLYPVFMNFSVFLLFSLSLHNTPMIEKIACKMGYHLDINQKKQTKRATLFWAIFMFCLTVISFITIFLSDEIWVLFNGLISYVLIAMIIGLEFLIHKRQINVHRRK